MDIAAYHARPRSVTEGLSPSCDTTPTAIASRMCLSSVNVLPKCHDASLCSIKPLTIPATKQLDMTGSTAWDATITRATLAVKVNLRYAGRMNEIHTTLRRLRRAADLRQVDVAEHLGVTATAIKAHEKGTYAPRLQHLAELAKLYGVTIDAIINGGDDATGKV